MQKVPLINFYHEDALDLAVYSILYKTIDRKHSEGYDLLLKLHPDPYLRVLDGLKKIRKYVDFLPTNEAVLIDRNYNAKVRHHIAAHQYRGIEPLCVTSKRPLIKRGLFNREWLDKTYSVSESELILEEFTNIRNAWVV